MEITLVDVCLVILDLENSELIFLHDTPAHDDASQHEVWQPNVWWFRRYRLDKHWNFDPLMWPWMWMQSSNFAHKALTYDDVSSDHVWLPMNQQFSRYSSRTHILIISALAVTLNLKTANKFLVHMTLWLMMLCHLHHTQFGNKMFCGSKDIIWTSIHWHFEPSMWLWP